MGSIRNEAIDLANKHLRPYNMRGNELLPDLCPFCKGGDSGDRKTFALNVQDGVYVCKRGSCGVRGTLEVLAGHLGEGIVVERPAENFAKKKYSLPKVELKPLTPEIIKYFFDRGISEKTLVANKVSADSNGNIVFPFYRNEQLVYVKYRQPRPSDQVKRKEWQETNTEPILFGMDMCSFSEPLIITEGMIDSLSCYEAGLTNVASVPSGCDNLNWIETCWDWLEKFNEFILFGDNDPPGKKMIQTVAKRLGEGRCSIVDRYPSVPDGSECKDANDILVNCGELLVVDAVESANQIPIRGLIDLGDVIPYDPTSVPRIKTGIPDLDEYLGGLEEGGLTVVTGKAAAGKSTLNGQFLLNALEQDWRVCAYSGELNKHKFLSWINLQAAGSPYITLKHDPIRGKEIPVVPLRVEERLSQHYKDRFFLFDNNEIFEHDQAKSIVEVFTMAVRRHNCKLFLVDNLMTSLSDSEEETRAQARFVSALKKFAIRYRVHMIVVAHPRKTKAGEELRNDDVAGSSAIVNLADSAISVERPNIRIMKNRDGGMKKLIECVYCGDSRRIYQANKGDLYRFSWDKVGIKPVERRADSLPEYGIQMAELPSNQVF